MHKRVLNVLNVPEMLKDTRDYIYKRNAVRREEKGDS